MPIFNQKHVTRDTLFNMPVLYQKQVNSDTVFDIPQLDEDYEYIYIHIHKISGKKLSLVWKKKYGLLINPQ